MTEDKEFGKIEEWIKIARIEEKTGIDMDELLAIIEFHNKNIIDIISHLKNKGL